MKYGSYFIIIIMVIIIKIYVPSYFKEFHCIADKCPDTCCAGWEVNLDPVSAEYYKTVGGDIGEKLRCHLSTDEDGDDIFILCGERCPFLNGDNLCELILTLGEDSISQTCTLFPRFYDNFGSFREMGLGFGCPEAAKIMLNNNEPFVLVEYGETFEKVEKVDEELLNILLALREKLFTILDSKGTFKKKISELLTLTETIQDRIFPFEGIPTGADFSNCIEVLSRMEYINEDRKNTLLSLTDDGFDRTVYEVYSDDFTKLMKYYIFRYLLKAVYDCEILTKVRYGVFACAVIGRLYGKGIDRMKAMYGFSKEVEYSDINIQVLDDAMFEDFGNEDLLRLF